MRFAWSTARDVVIEGGFAIIEHPDLPTQTPLAATIWRTREIVQLPNALKGSYTTWTNAR
eukprot:11168565-Lingulodinium_polyedra.AAC.1